MSLVSHTGIFVDLVAQQVLQELMNAPNASASTSNTVESTPESRSHRSRAMVNIIL